MCTRRACGAQCGARGMHVAQGALTLHISVRATPVSLGWKQGGSTSALAVHATDFLNAVLVWVVLAIGRVYGSDVRMAVMARGAILGNHCEPQSQHRLQQGHPVPVAHQHGRDPFPVPEAPASLLVCKGGCSACQPALRGGCQQLYNTRRFTRPPPPLHSHRKTQHTIPDTHTSPCRFMRFTKESESPMLAHARQHSSQQNHRIRSRQGSSVTVIVFEHLLANSNHLTTHNKVQGASALGGATLIMHKCVGRHTYCDDSDVHASEAVLCGPDCGHSTPDDGLQAVQPRMGVLQKATEGPWGPAPRSRRQKWWGETHDRALGAAPV